MTNNIKPIQTKIKRHLETFHSMYLSAKEVSDKSTDQAMHIRTHYIMEGYRALRDVAIEAGVEVKAL